MPSPPPNDLHNALAHLALADKQNTHTRILPIHTGFLQLDTRHSLSPPPLSTPNPIVSHPKSKSREPSFFFLGPLPCDCPSFAFPFQCNECKLIYTSPWITYVSFIPLSDSRIIRLGSFRFDSVRFGSVRFDSIRFGARAQPRLTANRPALAPKTVLYRNSNMERLWGRILYGTLRRHSPSLTFFGGGGSDGVKFELKVPDRDWWIGSPFMFSIGSRGGGSIGLSWVFRGGF